MLERSDPEKPLRLIAFSSCIACWPAPGSIKKVLATVKKIKPKIFTMVEQEANHNGPVFVDLFTESLHYYLRSSLFDSLEGSVAMKMAVPPLVRTY